MVLATIAALPMFVFENPNSPGAATEVAAAVVPERAQDLDAGDTLETLVIELVMDASVYEVAVVLPALPAVTAPMGSARLEAEARAQEGILFAAAALALAAELAETEFTSRQALDLFLEAKEAEAQRQAQRARLRAEEEDRRAEANATPGPTTTISAASMPAAVGPTAAQWEALRFCESSGNYGAISPTGNYRGGYQFSLVTWDWIAGIYHRRLVGLDPAEVAPADQDAMAQSLYDLRGRGQWPVCGRYLP